MYTSFFGLKHRPFQLTPDPEFLFMSRVHRRVLTYLNYGITENSGFILITGEIGAGKTTIIRSMIKQIPREIKIAKVTNTKVTSNQLISMINQDFGIHSKDNNKARLISDLTDYLIEQYANGGRSMIVIDEAQNLSVKMLEEIRLLSNIETDKSKLLQIILIGQPELKDTISRPELEQLRQRIAVNTHINPLSRVDVESYIKHRLKVAGNENAVKFGEGVMDAIFGFSKGIPRLINIICDYILLAVFVDGKKLVDLDLVKEVIIDLMEERPNAISSAKKAQVSLKEDMYGEIKKTLSDMHLKLRNLEKGIKEIQNGTRSDNENKRPPAISNKRSNKNESELTNENKTQPAMRQVALNQKKS
jgi:putative secretion ATPase (PEP-CTERM system associated)